MSAAGLKNQLMAGFTRSDGSQIERKVRPIFLVFDEDSICDRSERIRGFSCINQVEKCLLVTRDTLVRH